MHIRKATIDDIPALIKLRLDYLTEDRGSLSLHEEMAIKRQLEGYLPEHILNQSFIAVLAEENGTIVSTAYLVIAEKPANPSFINGLTGTLLNVLTYSDYRQKGIATKVIEQIIDEAALLGVSSISLSATNAGKPLYEKLGFSVSNYTAMNINLI